MPAVLGLDDALLALGIQAHSILGTEARLTYVDSGQGARALP